MVAPLRSDIRRAAINAIFLVAGAAVIAAGIYSPWIASLERPGRPSIRTAMGYDWLSSTPQSS